MQGFLRVHAFVPISFANGPGARATVWLQGCTLGCPGCFNPETHRADGGRLIAPSDLLEQVIQLNGRIEGITITGGEPLHQLRPLATFLGLVRTRTSLSVLLFTGYTWGEVSRIFGASEILQCVDVLLAGRYDASRRSEMWLRGSTNKTIHLLTSRYSLADLAGMPSTEIHIDGEGVIVVTGLDPPELE